MAVVTPQQYQILFVSQMDYLANKHGFRGKVLSSGEIRELINETCELVRQTFHIPDSEHLAYKEMMQTIVYGKNKGRK